MSSPNDTDSDLEWATLKNLDWVEGPGASTAIKGDTIYVLPPDSSTIRVFKLVLQKEFKNPAAQLIVTSEPQKTEFDEPRSGYDLYTTSHLYDYNLMDRIAMGVLITGILVFLTFLLIRALL